MFSPYIHISYALMSGNQQSISNTVIFPFCEYQMNAIMIYSLLRLASVSQHNGFGGSSFFK